jgi:hypothetical protein
MKTGDIYREEDEFRYFWVRFGGSEVCLKACFEYKSQGEQINVPRRRIST